MKEEKDNLQPDTIDHVIEGDELSQQDRQTTRLIRHLHTSAQEYAQENERSLDRIWSRLAQNSEHSVFLQAQWKQPEKRYTTIKEIKVMQQDDNVSWGMNPPTPLSQPKKRRSILRMVGLSLVAAVAIITILSFTVFSGVLRPAPQTTNKGQTTSTGAPGQQQQSQQPAISNGKLVCSVGFDVRALPPFDYSITRVDWSTQGKIAVSADENFTTFSAKNCSAKSIKPTTVYEASWSPDGKKLVTASSSAATLDVRDSNGNSITNIPFTQLGAIFVGDLTWSSDSTKLFFISQESNHQSSIKSVDAANGGNVKTLMKIAGNDGTSGALFLSPDGKYILMSQLNKSAKRKDLSIWDVNSGKKMSDLPSNDLQGGFSAAVFSPDNSLFAIGGNGKVLIYSTTDGKLQSSFNDPDAGTGVKGLASLAWSPDGKYLAESATSINIYDVNAKKIVTIFGKVAANHKIFGLAWAPDDSGLVSSADLTPDDGHSQTLVNVWGLS